MRVVHVDGEKGFSGGEVQLFLLMERLRRAGVEQVLVVRRGGEAAARAREAGFPAREAPMGSSADLPGILALRRIFRALRPDVLHFHTSRAHVLGAWAALGLGVPARVVTRRMDYPLRRDPVVRFLYGRAVDRVIAISGAVRREVLRLGIPGDRVVLIPSGVEIDRFAPLRERNASDRAAARSSLGIPADGRPVAGTAASLHRRKGADVLLRAAARLAGEGTACHLVIAGEGPERDALHALAGELGLLGEGPVRVHLAGQVRPPERVLAALDVFVLASRKEGLGVAALEAMAAGLPVVASRVGGLAESVVDGETGLLVPPEDAGALATALGGLLRDPALRARLGAAGARRVAERYSADAMAAGNLALYRDLLGASGG